MKRTIIAAAALAVSSLAVVGPAPSAQAHPLAYSDVQYVNKGTLRVISVKCHSNGQWRGMRPGMNSREVCALNGWVDQIWVDADVTLKMQLRSTGDVGNFGLGYRGLVFPGDWNVWVNKVVGA